MQMKKLRIIGKVFLFAVAIMLCGCDDTMTDIGLAIQPKDDGIDVYTDTFHVEGEDWMIPAISAQADTMVLGCFYSPVYGTTKAELLLQLAAPEGYSFPPDSLNPTPDSLALLLYYSSYSGDAYSPMQFSVYEKNKNDINYTDRYYSDLDPSDYCDTSILMGKRVYTAIDLTRRDSLSEDSASTPYIRYKFNETQAKRFFDIVHKNPTISTDEFLKQFKGLYIKTDYGKSTMIYLNQVTLYLYYHYTYRREGHDTIVKTSIAFPANHEVRQLNRFMHPDRDEVVASIPDSLMYIKSVAGIYPKIRIPFNRLCQHLINAQLLDETKTLNISSAELEIECMEDDEADEYTAIPAALMAISSASLDDYLKRNTLVTGTEEDRVLATYSSTTDSYTFDFAYLLTKAVRRAQNEEITPDSVMEFVIVPMNIEYTTTSSGTTSLTGMRPMVKLVGTRIRSPKNTYSPMRLKIFYEGY